MTDAVFFLKAAAPKISWPSGVKLITLDPSQFSCGGADAYCSTAYSSLYGSLKDGSGRVTPTLRKKHSVDGKIVFVSFSAGLGFMNPLLNNDADRADTAGVVLMDSTFGSGGYSGYQKAATEAAGGAFNLVTVTSDKGTTDSSSNGDYAWRNAVLKPTGLLAMPQAAAVPPMPESGEGVFHQGSLWYYRYKDAEYAHQNLGKLLAPVSTAHVLPMLSGAGVGPSGATKTSPLLVAGGIAAAVGLGLWASRAGVFR